MQNIQWTIRRITLFAVLAVGLTAFLGGCDIARDVKAAIDGEGDLFGAEDPDITPLFAPVPRDLQAQVTEAKPILSEFLYKAACVAPRDGREKHIRLNRFAASRHSPYDFTPPREKVRFGVERCLDIQAIGNWQRLGTNAIGLTATYLAESSGETAAVELVMQRQADGQWLFKF